MTIHPILIASMVSVHVAGYETKSTPLKKRHWRTFCHRGNSVDFAGLEEEVYISLHLYGIVSGYFTRCLLLFWFASATCFCCCFFLAFCKAKRVIVSGMADFSLSQSEDSQKWQVFPTTATTTATFHRVTLVWRDPLKLRSLKSSPVLLFICHPKSRLRQSKQTF